MRKFWLVATILLTLTGCAWTAKQVDYAKLCNEDPACLAQAKKDAGLVQTLVGFAYPAAAGAASTATLGLMLWWRGRKKEEKNGKA